MRFILLPLTIFIFSHCTTSKYGCQPEKRQREIKFKGFMGSIQGTVDFIQREKDSTTIYIKHKRLYNNYGYDHYFAKLKNPIPDSIKLGTILRLYRTDDACGYVFKPV